MKPARQEWRTSLAVEDAVKCLPSDAFDLWIAGKLDIVSSLPPPPLPTGLTWQPTHDDVIDIHEEDIMRDVVVIVRATIRHDYPEGAA